MSESKTYSTKSNTARTARKEHPGAAFTVYPVDGGFRYRLEPAVTPTTETPAEQRSEEPATEPSEQMLEAPAAAGHDPEIPDFLRVTPEVAEQRRKAWDAQAEKQREQRADAVAAAPKAAKRQAEAPKAKQGPSNNDRADALLKRPDGATVAEIMEVTGWLPHTTRARISNLRKAGAEIVTSKLPGADRVYRLVEPSPKA